MPERKSRIDGERTRGKILAAAEREFAEKGYELASVREISRRAGVNMALANRYFGSKEGLYRIVAKRLFGDLGEPMTCLPEEQNLDMNLVSSKVKQLINNIFENVGKIIELNTRQIYEYREILYKLDTSKNIKYLNLIDFIKKVENNFNENHNLSLEILESLKFLPPENFKEEYIKVIKKEEESPFDFIDNTNKSGEESISERFYFSIDEDSNKEKTNEKNNIFKNLNEKDFKLNEPK